jgi:hypothetical protein
MAVPHSTASTTTHGAVAGHTPMPGALFFTPALDASQRGGGTRKSLSPNDLVTPNMRARIAENEFYNITSAAHQPRAAASAQQQQQQLHPSQQQIFQQQQHHAATSALGMFSTPGTVGQQQQAMFSTTPSVSVPLAFGTPSQNQAYMQRHARSPAQHHGETEKHAADYMAGNAFLQAAAAAVRGSGVAPDSAPKLFSSVPPAAAPLPSRLTAAAAELPFHLSAFGAPLDEGRATMKTMPPAHLVATAIAAASKTMQQSVPVTPTAARSTATATPSPAASVPGAAGVIQIPLSPLAKLVRSLLARGQFPGAEFYADKLLTLAVAQSRPSAPQGKPKLFAAPNIPAAQNANNAPAVISAVNLLVEVYLRSGQFQRAVHVLRTRGLLALPSLDRAAAAAEREAAKQQQTPEKKTKPDDADVSFSSPSADEGDDHSDASLGLHCGDPLLLRIECLYQGLQCLVELKQYDDALALLLPSVADREASERKKALMNNDNNNRSNDSALPSAEELALEGKWERETEEILAICAPSSSVSAAATLGDTDMHGVQHPADAAAAAAATVREVIGEDEFGLVNQLAKLKFVQAARRNRRSNQSNRDATQAQGSDPADSIDLCSSLCYLRGQLYDLQSCKYKAVLWYKLALQFDVRNFDAFAALTSGRLLSSPEIAAMFYSSAVPGAAPALLADSRFSVELKWIRLLWLNSAEVERIDPLQEGPARGHGLPAPKQTTDAAGAIVHVPSQSGPEGSLMARYNTLVNTYQFGNNHQLLASLIEYKYHMGRYRDCEQLCQQ